ncbi:MAG: hypothetical protein ACM3SY_22650 [Candidatus Omnitrophota bacterium]
MVQLVSHNPIIKKIAEGSAKEDIFDLLIARQLPFTEEEYLEAFVLILKNDAYKAKALEHLKQITESIKFSYIEKHTANPRVAFFVLLEALQTKNTRIIARMIRNQMFPSDFLLKIAEKGNAPMLEALLDNQIKLIAYPEIMDIMEKNPEASAFIKIKIKETRDYYLNKENVNPIAEADVLEDIKKMLALDQKKPDEPSEETQEQESDDSSLEKKTLTTLQEINAMSISERIKLAMSGTRTHRMILIKDSNKMVSLAVVESPKLTADEVMLIARNKSIPGDVIEKISRNREWTKNYTIITELVQNPKTPLKDALSFIGRLHIQDLKLLGRDKNVNPVVRQAAFQRFSQKDNR